MLKLTYEMMIDEEHREAFDQLSNKFDVIMDAALAEKTDPRMLLAVCHYELCRAIVHHPATVQHPLESLIDVFVEQTVRMWPQIVDLAKKRHIARRNGDLT